jgi:hypothetical protein
MSTLPAFTEVQVTLAKRLLATQVASMMGRKLEEGDWTRVYCRAKGIPEIGWSNLHIDVNYQGLGVELKLLRCSQLNGKPLKTVCGTTLMHPSATRSIRIDDLRRAAGEAMRDVFAQYAELIAQRTQRVREAAGGSLPDMRVGWLLWEDSLTEFLYFEERMRPPDPSGYYAEWNVTPARGVRKTSKSLWVFERKTHKKRFSVTTSAGVKIQPYFDVPPPSDPHLYYFRVQSEPVDADTVRIWVSASTAHALEERLGSLDRAIVSDAVAKVASSRPAGQAPSPAEEDLAVPILISRSAHAALLGMWDAVSDEHRAQLLLKALS